MNTNVASADILFYIIFSVLFNIKWTEKILTLVYIFGLRAHLCSLMVIFLVHQNPFMKVLYVYRIVGFHLHCMIFSQLYDFLFDW